MATILAQHHQRARGSLPMAAGRKRTSTRRGHKIADEQLRERAKRLLAMEIAFIPHPSFAGQMTDEGEDASGVSEHASQAQRRSTPLKMCAAPLLTAAQEQSCFRRMNWLRYRANVLRSSLDPDNPDATSVNQAERLLDQAQAIRDRIVCANLRLVMSVVKRFPNTHESMDELFSDAVVILFKAVEKFDFARGFRFSTYAYRAIATHTYRGVKLRADRRTKFVPLSQSHSELATEHSVPGDMNLAILRVGLKELLTNLTPRERFVISARFALGSRQKARTFQSLADELGLSKKRVRQVNQRALVKLHGIAAEMGLAEFVEP